MKLVQFVYPMFLVALGLHVAVLFVPIRGTPEAVVEDLELSDRPEVEAPADKLSIPDLAVSADPPMVETGRPASTRPAASSTRVGATRPSISTIAVRAPSSPLPVPSVSASSLANSSSQLADQPSPADTNLPELAIDSRPDTEDRQDTAENTLVLRSAEDSEQPTLSDLIASASTDLPPSLRQLVAEIADALTYREAGTSEAIAQQKRADWEAKIRTQANVEAVEVIAPTQFAGLTPINYPIQSAEDAEVLSYSACLEKAPHNAEVGVLFDSQGNIATEPELIRSTGYEALNKEILAVFGDIDSFSNIGEDLDLDNRRSKAYLFEVAIDYQTDACVSLEKLRSSESFAD